MNAKELEIMERLHDAQLKLLVEFDAMCRKYNLTYYIAAGTLLGAVRHKDFIPWDDDIDIYLKRKDFNKFLQHKDEFEEPFEIYQPTSDDKFFWDYATRLVYKKSRLKFDEKENAFYEHKNNEYLFLDIFVLDKAHDGIRNTIQLLKLKMLYGMAMSRRYSIDYDDYDSFIQKCQVAILSILGKLFPLKTLFNLYEKESQKYNNDPTANYEQPTHITVKFLGQLFYKTEWHKESIELPIRGKNFLAPKEYHQILTKIYGDYMVLPPEENRLPDHIKVLDKIQID